MSFLEKHQPVDIERQAIPDPLLRAKRKLADALNRQIENVRNPGQVTHRGRGVQQWWFRHEDGEIYTHVRFGMRPMEFPTGKAFRIGDEEGLIAFYEEVLAALDAGELDEIVERTRKIGARRSGRRGYGRRGTRGHRSSV